MTRARARETCDMTTDGATSTRVGGERENLLRADVERGSARVGSGGDDDGVTRVGATRGRVAIVTTLSALALVCLGVSAVGGGRVRGFGALGASDAEARPSFMHVSGGDDVATLGGEKVVVSKMRTPIYIMGDAKPGSEDAEKIGVAYTWLSGILKQYAGMSTKDVEDAVMFQQATFPSRWPETHDVAKAAVAEIDPKKLERIPFISGALSNNAAECGRPCNSQLGHHTGCLLTHMRVWSRVLESDASHFVLWESDGHQLLSVSPLDYDSLIEQLPKDTDLVWLKQDDTSSAGQFLKRFKSHATGTWTGNDHRSQFDNEQDVYLYKFDKRCNWAGTPAYLMSRKGVQKIMDFIRDAESVDMIDAWMSKQCIMQCDDPKLCMGLKCYYATTQRVPKEVQGGYVPSWYETVDDEKVREVDSSIVQAMDDVAKYNALGCRHSNQYVGFIPMQFDGAFNIHSDKFIWDCYHSPTDGKWDFCDVKQKYPVSTVRKEATLGGTEEAGSRDAIVGFYERGFLERMKLLGISFNWKRTEN